MEALKSSWVQFRVGESEWFVCLSKVDFGSWGEGGSESSKFFSNGPMIQNDIYSNLMKSLFFGRGHWTSCLCLLFVSLWASKIWRQGAFLRHSWYLTLQTECQALPVYFQLSLRQRLIGLTSCCHILRDMNLQHSSLNSLISLNTVCLCSQNVIS